MIISDRNSTIPSSQRRLSLAGGARPLAILSAAALLAVGCSKPEAPPKTEVPVQAATVEKQAIEAHVSGDAVLAPVAQAAISPRITAPVRKFYVQRGGKVRAGQLLAVLENRDLAAAALDNKGAYTQAQATYNTATNASIPEDTQKAQLDEAQAKANLDLAQKVFDSRESLFKQGAIPARDLDTARAALVQARSAYDIAATHLRSVQAIGRTDALKAAQGQLISAQGKYQGAEAQLGYSEIRSPINGVVTDRPLYAGETAAAGAALITVMDVSSLLAKTHLAQSEAINLKVGQPATIQVGGLDKPVDGKVALVSPELDPGSTTLEVWVKVPNPKGMLKAGTPVHLSIVSRQIPDALVIPKEAVLTNPAGKKMAMVVGADNVAHQRAIESGVEDDGQVQVLSGLKLGEQVVTNGAYAMDDGTKVKIVAPGEENADSKEGDAKESDAKGGDDKAGDAKGGDAKSGAAKDEGGAKPSGAKKAGDD